LTQASKFIRQKQYYDNINTTCKQYNIQAYSLLCSDTEVAHVTSDSDTSFKVKRSKVNLLLMS